MYLVYNNSSFGYSSYLCLISSLNLAFLLRAATSFGFTSTLAINSSILPFLIFLISQRSARDLLIGASSGNGSIGSGDAYAEEGRSYTHGLVGMYYG